MNGCGIFRKALVTDADKYLNHGYEIDSDTRGVLPNLEDLPKYENIEYQYIHDAWIFIVDTVTLVVKYDDATYESEKNKLDEEYTFLDENTSPIIEYKFSINSYDLELDFISKSMSKFVEMYFEYDF